MKEPKVLYAITIEDLADVSNEENIPFVESDLPFIEDKIGDYIGDKWHDAIKYALEELEGDKQSV